MDLSRGVCVLCTNNTKIIVPPKAEGITSLIKDFLADQIDYGKFDEVNTLLKVCPICLYDILAVANLKQNITEDFSKGRSSCALCCTEKHLVFITEWAHFDKILENVTTRQRPSRCSVCWDCIKCLDLLEKFKTNLFKKYPDLELSSYARERKRSEARKEEISKKAQKERTSRNKFESDEESEWSPPSATKNVNNLKTALRHLTPLIHSKFKVDEFKRDKKLVKQVAFVKLNVSNISSKDYGEAGSTPKGTKREKPKRSISLSDTESSGDMPNPKPSFFKIRLKINPSKMKIQKVTSGKISKPKYKSKLILGNKKELIVKILKMDFDNLTVLHEEDNETAEIRTPTKASRKMLPDDPLSNSKKRKSVTFADVLDTEITEGVSHKDHPDATPLKSLLKKSVSPTTDLLKNFNEGLDVDSDEESNAAKGYVEEILKNNDNIFDSLKVSKNTEEISDDRTISGSSYGIDSDSSVSEDGESQKLDGKNTRTNKNSKQKGSKKPLGMKKSKKGEIVDIGDSDSDKIENSKVESENQTSSDNEEQEENKERSAKNKKKSTKSLNRSNSNETSDLQEGSKNEEPLESNDEESNEVSSTVNSEIIICNEENENSSQNLKSSNDDPLSNVSETNSDDLMITLAEFKKLKKIEGGKDGSEENNEKNDNDVPNEDSSSDTIIDRVEVTNENDNVDGQISAKVSEDKSENNINDEIISNERIDESNQVEKHSSGMDSDTENNSKNNSLDLSNLGTKSRKRRKSIVEEEEEEDISNNSKDDECFEEPESKREKVSEGDNLSSSDVKKNNDSSEKKSEDKLLGVSEEKRVDTVDVDELIAKYTNPCIPDVNNDNNVSDTQNVVISDKDRESRPEVSSDESEALDKSINGKEVILEKSTETVNENITSLVENDSEGDNSRDIDMTDNCNIASREKGLDLDNILENVVDTC